MIRNKLRKAAGAVCAVGMAASTAHAAGVLEEVVVTAQLRAQSLQDVPVSVNAVSGDKMMEAGLDKIEDLQAYVPNLTMSETGIGTNIYIRGIGSGINQGFEQSVGMYFDGVYYGRAQLSRAPFLDLERVEVLRGPQNILYGKNSIAGALSLISRRPGQEFEGSAAITYEPEHGEEVYDLILSGPVNDALGARFAVRHKKFDGYIENLTLDRDEPARDETTARLILDWAATDRMSVVTKFEVGSFDVTGRQIEILDESPSTSDSAAGFGGNTYAQILDRTTFGIGPVNIIDIDADSSVLNNFVDFKRSSNGDFSNNDTQNVTVNVDYSLDSGANMTFITGYLAYEFEEDCDCDFTGADVFSVESEEDYTQFSQEFRYVSPVGETFEYITGAYYQKSELEFFDSIIVDSTILPQLINAADLAEGGARGDIQDGSGDAGDEVQNLGTPRDFFTDTELLSAFLQVTWNASDVLRVTAGGRYTYEEKEGARSLDFIDITTGQRRPEGEVDTVVGKNFEAERHSVSGDRSGGKFSPSLNIQWDVNDMMMAYTTISKGFKSGGFDARSNASPGAEDVSNDASPLADPVILIGSFEFDDEEALSFELGAKSTWLGGALELNAALFYTEYSELQVSIFDGTLGFNVGNAAKAVTMGLELDGRYAVTDKIVATYALAFLDFEFQDFTNGQCFQNQTPDSPTDPELCDYDGKTNQYVADYSGNVGFTYTDYVTRDLEFRGSLDAVFTGDYNPSQNLDPRTEQGAYVEFNARLALSNVAQGWEVALVGKNLTDRTIRTYQNDTPLANSIFEAPSYYAFLKRPRSIALALNYRF